MADEDVEDVKELEIESIIGFDGKYNKNIFTCIAVRDIGTNV